MSRQPRQTLTEYLVLGAQGGDAGAFAQLHAAWSADLRRFAMVRLGRTDAVDEVCQDAWIAISGGLRRLDDPACFPSWALRIVERRCCDWLRRRRAEAVGAEPLTDQLMERIAAPDSFAEEADDVTRLRTAIARLAPDSRSLLHLFYEQELPVAEVAAVLDVPLGTVKSRLHTLRETLRRQLTRRSE
jgi:RNA polymerase sigma-70 factor, ECF subfamily